MSAPLTPLFDSDVESLSGDSDNELVGESDDGVPVASSADATAAGATAMAMPTPAVAAPNLSHCTTGRFRLHLFADPDIATPWLERRYAQTACSAK